MNILEWLIVGMFTMAKLSVIVLFVVMLVNPKRFSTRMKVAICVAAFFAFLPIRPRSFFR